MSESKLRKRPLDDVAPQGVTTGQIDVSRCASVGYTSEHPAHPVEYLFDGSTGLGGTRWVSAREDTVERILLQFDQPTSLSRLVYEVEEGERERTQEVRISVSSDGGQTYRQVLVQDFVFSPGGATFQREDLCVPCEGVTHIQLTIDPIKSGSGPATLTCFQLFR